MSSLVMDDLVKLHGDSNYCTSLLILPTELLVMILSYLSIQNIIKMQFVSQRFKEISAISSLWKKFVWPDCEPRHMCMVRKVLKTHGIHVRQISFPVHVTPANLLEMMHNCSKVTHLSLPRYTQLSLDHLEEIVHTLTHLEQLDVFISSIKYGLSRRERYINYKQLLEVTTTSVNNLTLKIDWDEGEDYFNYAWSIEEVSYTLEHLIRNNHPLPSIINLLICDQELEDILCLGLEYCLASSYTIASIEIGLYNIARVPMDLHPSVPLRKFQFGPAAKPPLIKLSDLGILGLDKDIFYLSEYSNYRLSVGPKYSLADLVKDEHLHYISNFNSVSNVNFSKVNIYPNHLKQLAIACPNLERLNLKNAQNSLQSLQGLRAIVDTCQNLQGLNLVGIPVSSMESYLLLWELLSSIKKLTYLGIDLSMLIHINNNCYNADDKDKLICMLGNCNGLKALEVMQQKDCELCLNVSSANHSLLGHFPSLVHVRISLTQTECTKYAITSCRQLKYLYYNAEFYIERAYTLDLPSLSNCHLQELFVKSYIDLSASSAQVLSAHGELEQVILLVRSITTSAITTLISNSPNLMLLYIVTKEPLCDENGASVDQKDYKDTVSSKFSDHKLLTAGDLILTCTEYCYNCTKQYWTTRMPFRHTTNCNSFWKL